LRLRPRRNWENSFMQKDLDAIAKRIIELQVEHRDLDQVIFHLTEVSSGDALQLRRLKKRKLQIKDQITWLQIQLTPDIPA
jgi:hypothetical protein